MKFHELCKSERQEALESMRDLELCDLAENSVLPVSYWEQIAQELSRRLREWSAPKTESGFPDNGQPIEKPLSTH